MAKENIVISLGGSLVAPSQIDTLFLKRFKATILKFIKTKRFFIVVGGGRICRDYQKALQEFGADTQERDMVGIDVSRLNARVVRQLFGDLAYSQVLTGAGKTVATRKDIVVVGGFKPGASTDWCAVEIAKNMGIKTIVNLSNIDYVYDLPASAAQKALQAGKDPFKNAKAFKEIDWKNFRKIVGSKWAPGMNMPFDSRASKEAEVLKIKVVVMNGQKLERLENFLKGNEFIGTVIS